MPLSGPIRRPASTFGFEASLDMLPACHRRVEQQCSTLRRLAAQLSYDAPDEDARVAAAAGMRSFGSAAKDHHADEETDLFSALLESMAGSDAVCIRDLIDSLTLDHRALESRWRRLRAVLQSVAAGAPVTLASTDVEPFLRFFERHIAREDAELLPMASRLLGDEALNDLGKAMRERRGISSFD
jgi:hemerythrin-like domain-containing protein